MISFWPLKGWFILGRCYNSGGRHIQEPQTKPNRSPPGPIFNDSARKFHLSIQLHVSFFRLYKWQMGQWFMVYKPRVFFSHGTHCRANETMATLLYVLDIWNASRSCAIDPLPIRRPSALGRSCYNRNSSNITPHFTPDVLRWTNHAPVPHWPSYRLRRLRRRAIVLCRISYNGNTTRTIPRMSL